MKNIFRLLLLLLLSLTLYAACSFAEERNLVIVTGAHSPIKTLNLSEVRRLYLGVSFPLDGQDIITLRNNSDPLLEEVFMQRVMFMSTEAYERQILNRVFRAGGQRPQVYTKIGNLIEALDSNPWAVSYMWKDAALENKGIRIIGNE